MFLLCFLLLGIYFKIQVPPAIFFLRKKVVLSQTEHTEGVRGQSGFSAQLTLISKFSCVFTSLFLSRVLCIDMERHKTQEGRESKNLAQILDNPQIDQLQIYCVQDVNIINPDYSQILYWQVYLLTKCYL